MQANPVISIGTQTPFVTEECGKDATNCNDSPVKLGNVGAKDVGLVPDLLKDDLLSRLKWKSSRKRKHGNAQCLQKLNYSRNLIKNTAGSVSCERLLIPASIKVDNDNCKYIGDPLFSPSVVSPLTSLVMTRSTKLFSQRIFDVLSVKGE